MGHLTGTEASLKVLRETAALIESGRWRVLDLTVTRPCVELEGDSPWVTYEPGNILYVTVKVEEKKP